MKNYVPVIILICCATSAFTQKKYLDIVVDSTCKCLERGKDKIKNADDLDKLGERCILKAAMPYLDSFSKDENIPVEDLNDEIGNKIGQKIGMKLITSCPSFVDMMALYSEENEDTDIVTGVVTGVQVSDHVYLNIKEPSGKITKLVWVQYFPGADAYKSNPAKLNGKKVSVEWKESEIYHIAKKDFISVKLITGLTVK